ncbi:MAG: glycosyltransferase [Planctomycetota bacterium]
MRRVRVSVVIPTYNRRDLLPRAVESAAARITGDDEIIVVDDGSTDGTADAIRNDSRVTLIETENRGPAAARNAAIEVATGRFLAFLDSDDAWYPTGLDEQVEALDKDDSLGLSHAEAMNEVLPGAATTPRARPTREGDVLATLLRRNFVTTSTAVVPRRVLDQVGRFDESLDRSMDWDLWLRIAERYRFHFLRRTVALYRFHADQQIRDRESVDDCRQRILRKALARLEARDDPLVPVTRRYLAYRLLRLGRQRLAAGKRDEAGESFRAAADVRWTARFTAWRYRWTVSGGRPCAG